MFTEREQNETIFYSGGTLVAHKIIDGDDLTLRSGDQDVLVRSVKILGPDHYSGTIYGFEPSRTLEHNGLQLDQAIEFYDKNIFGVRGA
ncbi:hypothetical protein [Xanthomonas cannabis]|uniref:hypothetical protein n=1 Tax=Xanthomonas cannabis TaxID=1885674 RepID=UPI00141BE4B7|nr:hypothetical protein [Xanthomonas cannabis]NIK19105.1 hypothetical protein [Xanthomonas cannabis]